MDFDAIVPVVIIVIFLLSGLKKVLQGVAEQAQRQAGGDAKGYSATAEQVREFLRKLGEGPQAPAEQAEPAAPPMVERVERPPARAGGMERLETSVPPLVTQPVARRRTARRSARARRTQTPEAAARQAAARATAGDTGTEVAAAAVVEGIDLRQAVIWSEILGKPVSMRRSRRGGRLGEMTR